MYVWPQVHRFVMSITYAIPDLHGRIDLLDSAIERIASHAGRTTCTIVSLGDYIDRGPHSAQVIDRLMNWQCDTMRLVALKGNHEAMMWQVCNNLSELDHWIENGGDQTLRSYGGNPEERVAARVVRPDHLTWIASLRLMHLDQHRVFVHAGVESSIPLDRQSEQTLLWKRYRAGSIEGHGGRHVVHGHHATLRAPLVTKFRTNLDGLAWKSGRLVIGVFQDNVAGGAVEFLEIRT
jgi:serine/threonine protein phosphatase 1